MQGVKAEGKVKRFGGSAYTLDEIQRMAKKLDEPARTVVLTAALSGLRESERRGLRWEDFRDGMLQVQRSVWRTHGSEQLKT
jgi:integrase